MAYQIEWRKKGVLVRCSGSMDIQDIHEANGKLHGSSQFDNHLFQIWDFLNANLESITLDEMEEPAATDQVASTYAPNVKVAIVVRDPHSVKLMCHYAEKSGDYETDWKCQIFDTMAKASEWIGL